MNGSMDQTSSTLKWTKADRGRRLCPKKKRKPLPMTSTQFSRQYTEIVKTGFLMSSVGHNDYLSWHMHISGRCLLYESQVLSIPKLVARLLVGIARQGYYSISKQVFSKILTEHMICEYFAAGRLHAKQRSPKENKNARRAFQSRNSEVMDVSDQNM